MSSQTAITYGVRAILGAVDGNHPFEEVGLRDKLNLHIFRRLQLEVRELLDCREHRIQR